MICSRQLNIVTLMVYQRLIYNLIKTNDYDEDKTFTYIASYALR